MALRIAETVASIRMIEIRKRPSVSESLDWARALLALGLDVDSEATIETLNVLLKHRTDIERVAEQLRVVGDR
jgi:hypothetical protein